LEEVEVVEDAEAVRTGEKLDIADPGRRGKLA
jgi:hypothetical protein